jgi:hypothetical protein
MSPESSLGEVRARAMGWLASERRAQRPYASESRSATKSQLTTFHQASM